MLAARPVPAAELAKAPPKQDTRHDGERQYANDIPKNREPAIELLKQYSGIKEEEVENHILTIRAKAFAVHPYPCVSGFRFLDLSISRHPLYPSLLQRMKTDPSQTLIDLGCCFGQDLRCLAADGVSTANLYGSDLYLEFLDLGYELFRDEDRFPRTQFFAGDLVAPLGSAEEGDLKKVNGKIDIIYAASLLHLWGWERQIAACTRMVKLFKPEEKNALILGRQGGSEDPGNYAKKVGEEAKFSHDPRTFQELWDVVGEKTGTKWEVEARLLELPPARGSSTRDSKTRRLEFAVRRLA